MKISVMAAGLAVTAMVVGAAVGGCSSKKSSTASPSPTSSASATSATSTSAAAQPSDYSTLLIKASDIPGDTWTMQQPQLNPGGKPGVAAMFSNPGDTREIGDTIMVLPNASDAASALQATITAAGPTVNGAAPQPADVGTGGTMLAGTSPDGAKAITILMFSEGKGVVTLEFDSAANDPVPPDGALDIARKQDTAIKNGLPA
jgi:hypothetical protein